MSIYRLYRPQIFGELYEQEHIRRTLQNALKKNEVAHAYIFSGPRGTGKTSTARLLSKALLCEDIQDNEPCGKCSFCQGIEKGSEMDLIEVDAASHTGVNDVRLLIEKGHFAPTRAQKKVYIIDEVHMLSRSAFNALLKTLEEPPSHLHFILCTTELDKIPDTVVSRCQHFDFHRISKDNIIQKLEKIAKQENIKFDQATLDIIATQAEGGLRNAEVLFEQLASELDNNLAEEKVKENLGLAENQDVSEFLSLLENKKLQEAFIKISTLEETGVNFKHFTKTILIHLRQQLLSPETDPNKLDEILDLVKIFRKASSDIRTSLLPALPLEVAAVKAVNLKEKKKKKTKSLVTEKKTIPTLTSHTPSSKVNELKSDLELPGHIRNALKASDIKEKDDKIIIESHSEFFHNILKKPENFPQVSEAIKKIFGDTFTTEFTYVKIDKKDLPETFALRPTSPTIAAKKLTAEDAVALLDE